MNVSYESYPECVNAAIVAIIYSNALNMAESKVSSLLYPFKPCDAFIKLCVEQMIG